jgi:hypothetical protein
MFVISIIAIVSCKGNENKHAEIVNDSLQLTAPAKKEYTCPMHPEIITDSAAQCPRCGMNLEIRS